MLGLFEKRNEVTDLETYLLSGETGRAITEEKAMQIPALAGGITLIADTVAMLPIKLYERKTDSDEVIEIQDDRRTALLNQDTGDTLDASQFKSALVRDYLLHGAGFAYVNREGNRVQSLHYVRNYEVTVNPSIDAIFKDFTIRVQAKEYQPYEFIKLLRNTKNGWSGRGILSENSELINLAYSLMTLEAVFNNNGGVGRGFLQSENALSEDAIRDLRAAWRELYGTNKARNIPVLNKGVTFNSAMPTMVEQQLNERKQSIALDISRLLKIPTELLTGKYEEDIYSMAIKLSVSPLLDTIAVAINRVMLLESEKGVRFFAFDDRELLKGDTLKRYQAYALGIEKGFLQVDDVRYQENMPALGLEYLRLGLQDVLYDPKTKTFYTPNTGMTGKMGAGKEE